MLPIYVTAALCVLPVLAKPAVISSSLVEHERQGLVHYGWIKRAPVDGDMQVPVTIALTQSNLHRGEELLMEVSDPQSDMYGKWYDADTIVNLFEPSETTIDTVLEWLSSEGVAEHRAILAPTSQWIHLNSTVAELNAMLHTQFYHFEHSETGASEIACGSYHLPHNVAAHIDFVTPGVKLSFPKKRDNPTHEKRSNKPKTRPLNTNVERLVAMPPAKQCAKAITPACIKLLYNITDTYVSYPGNQVGVFSYGDKFNQKDLNKFFTKFNLHIPNGTHPTINSVNGGKAITKDRFGGDGETILDLSMVYPLLKAQDVAEFIIDDGFAPNRGFAFYKGIGLNDFLDAVDPSYCTYTAFGYSGKPVPGIDEPFPNPRKGGYKGKRQCGTYSPTNVVTISYGIPEGLVPLNYQRRQCSEFMKLAMMGVTTVASSGDFGVAQSFGGFGGCYGPAKHPVFQPHSPAICPYILSVGSTYLPRGADPLKDEEEATASFPSGGGFSNIYPTPSYQKAQVKNYFAKYVPDYPFYRSRYNNSFNNNGGIYNRAGRGYPDVSAVGDDIAIIGAGSPEFAGGTSASAPLWAGLLTRINAARLAAGMPTVGYVHPILYQNPQVFHDITKGSNPGCRTKGFPASKGWDPVTGLGTPHYMKLKALFMSAGSKKK